MDSSTAIQGATILILDLPPSALCGIDLLSFTTTPRFKGIKLLPQGLHFAFTSANTALSVRHGAWFRVHSNNDAAATQDVELFVKRWHARKEELQQETDATELLRWKANLGSIWRDGLTPYRQSAAAAAAAADDDYDDEEDYETKKTQDWRALTTHISDAVLSRITGPTPDHWTLTSASSALRDADDVAGLQSRDGSQIQSERPLTFFPVELKRTWRPGATGRERTDGARDHSWALGDLMEQHGGGKAGRNEILGEMQFCFLMVLTLNNYSCLEQWKRLLMLIFTCKTAVTEMPDFFIDAVATLRLQLEHSQDAEDGLFDTSGEGLGMLKALLRKFKKGLGELDGQWKSDIMDELVELETFIRGEYGWELDDSLPRRGMVTLEDGEMVEVTAVGYDEEHESGEYAPVVVDLSPEELKVLGRTRSPLRKKGGDDDDDEEEEEEEDDDSEIDELDTRF